MTWRRQDFAMLALLPPAALLATWQFGVGSVALAALLALALAAGVVLVVHPFIGVAGLILVSQIDALLAILLGSLAGIKLLTLATLGGAVLHFGFKRRKRPFRIDPAMACALIFCLAVVASSLLAAHPDLAARGTRRILSMVLLYVLVVVLVDSERKAGIALACIVISTAISAAIVVADSQLGGSVLMRQAASDAGDGFRSQGATLGDATTAASILLAGTSSALVIALRSHGRLRALAGAAAVVGIAGMTFSYTRSAMLAFGIGLAWQVWLRRRDPRVLLLAALGCLGLIVMMPSELLERFGALFGRSYDFTVARRLGYQLIGLDLLAKNPFLGVGPANFPAYYTDFDYRWVPGRTLIPRVLHNMYLAVGVEGGLVTLAAFLGILGLAFSRCLAAMRNTRSQALAFYAEATLFGFALLLLVSATLPNETNKYVWIYAGLATAIARIHLQQSTAAEPPA
jgi:O-antigen ligase